LPPSETTLTAAPEVNSGLAANTLSNPAPVVQRPNPPLVNNPTGNAGVRGQGSSPRPVSSVPTSFGPDSIAAYVFDTQLSIVSITRGESNVAVVNSAQNSLSEIQVGDVLPGSDIAVTLITAGGITLNRDGEKYLLKFRPQ